jgi:hypothetical protein
MIPNTVNVPSDQEESVKNREKLRCVRAEWKTSRAKNLSLA